MPLVLASNDVNVTDRYDWKDIAGVQYHYPNAYRNMILMGEEFVYYRGIRRINGRRGQAEYFGSGIVGEIWRDPKIPSDAPKKNWAWYCEIQDYVPFAVPVPAKIDGIFFEDIERNLWRNGVRKLSKEIFDHIITAAGIPLNAQENDPVEIVPHLPDIQAVEIHETPTSLMAPSSIVLSELENQSGVGRARWSRSSKIAGDRSEQIATRYIRERVVGATTIRHVAAEGETPGWDIEYKDADGHLNAVEVKGSSGSAFANFDITDGELNAARRLGRFYWIYLVSDCFGSNPKLQRVQDPAAMVDSRFLMIKPITWRIWRI